jgi:hypothetical protein
MANGAHNPLRQFPLFRRLSTRTLKKIAGIVVEEVVLKATPADERGGEKCVAHA